MKRLLALQPIPTKPNSRPLPTKWPCPQQVIAPVGQVSVQALAPGAAGTSRIPANFDVAGFERNAKVKFIRLQAANDAGDLDDRV